MGIFTSAGFSSSSVDIYSPAEEELCCEGFDINFYEASMVAVAESEAIYSNSMKEVGIAELRYFEENGQEVIYEAVDVKAIFNKIKMFFKKLIDKVKAIFHAFIAKLSSFGSDDKKFVQKYEKEFSRKWNEVKDDFEFKGYKFTIKNDITGENLGIASDLNEIDPQRFSRGGYQTFARDGVSAESINNVITSIKDNREDLEEKMRLDVYTKIATATAVETVTKETAQMDSKDFSEALFKLYRNDETSKENIEKKDLDLAGGVATITSELKTAAKTKKAAEKISKLTTKAIDQAIKEIDKYESATLKQIPVKTGNNATDNENTNKKSAMISLASETSSLLKSNREYAVQACGACLQALKDRSRQYKAIMVKVISGSKKMQRESYDYTNESYDGSGSFLDSVVLK